VAASGAAVFRVAGILPAAKISCSHDRLSPVHVAWNELYKKACADFPDIEYKT